MDFSFLHSLSDLPLIVFIQVKTSVNFGKCKLYLDMRRRNSNHVQVPLPQLQLLCAVVFWFIIVLYICTM